MLLVIDIGNTNCVYALYEGEERTRLFRASSCVRTTSDQYGLELANWLGEEVIASLESVIIGSVVPQLTRSLQRACVDYLQQTPRIIDNGMAKVDLDICIDNPRQLGADRIANAIAAKERYGVNCIVLDFGTATTFDVIDDRGRYVGGVITPGIELSLRALSEAAAQLPSITLAKPSKVIGTNTIDAMQSGLYFGYVSLIEGLIARIEKEQGARLTIIATGGLASFFCDAIDRIDHLDPHLTLDGFYRIAHVS